MGIFSWLFGPSKKDLEEQARLETVLEMERAAAERRRRVKQALAEDYDRRARQATEELRRITSTEPDAIPATWPGTVPPYHSAPVNVSSDSSCWSSSDSSSSSSSDSSSSSCGGSSGCD